MRARENFRVSAYARVCEKDREREENRELSAFGPEAFFSLYITGLHGGRGEHFCYFRDKSACDTKAWTLITNRSWFKNI